MLKRLISIIVVGLLLISCSGNTRQVANKSVKMPYDEWRIGGRYPSYFPAKVFGVSMITQSNQLKGLRIAIRPNRGENPGQWKIYTAGPDALDVYADLPQSLNVCWVSFVDQTFYRTEIDVPLSVRQQMIIPSKYISEATGEEIVRYNNAIILGFAPGGNVTAWLAGVVGRPWTQFTQVRSTNLGKNSLSCENPYPHGEIPQITPEAKAWLKTHGMPSYWQEKAD